MTPDTHAEDVKKIASIVRDIRFAMFTTVTAEGHLHARPMTTQQTEFDGDLWFIASRDSEAVANVRRHQQVNVSYANPDKNTYLSVNGQAELVDDRAKLEELWSDLYRVYFPGGMDDPNIQLLKIHAGGAEYWESDGKLRSLLGLARSLIKGEQADLGSNETVNL